MSNPLCEKVSVMNPQEQKHLFVTIVWSLRQRMRTFEGFEDMNVTVRSSLLELDGAKLAVRLTSMPAPEIVPPLKLIADCLKLIASQKEGVALTVLSSFYDAKMAQKAWNPSHLLCNLIKALIPEEATFLVDKQIVFTIEDDLLLAPIPGKENPFLPFLEGRLAPKPKESPVF